MDDDVDATIICFFVCFFFIPVDADCQRNAVLSHFCNFILVYLLFVAAAIMLLLFIYGFFVFSIFFSAVLLFDVCARVRLLLVFFFFGLFWKCQSARDGANLLTSPSQSLRCLLCVCFFFIFNILVCCFAFACVISGCIVIIRRNGVDLESDGCVHGWISCINIIMNILLFSGLMICAVWRERWHTAHTNMWATGICRSFSLAHEFNTIYIYMRIPSEPGRPVVVHDA